MGKGSAFGVEIDKGLLVDYTKSLFYKPAIW